MPPGPGSFAQLVVVAETVAAVRPRVDRHRPRVSLALGGDCLADIATCANTAVFGKVPFDPTACRLIAALFADAPAVLTAIDIIAQNPIVIDLDATLVTAHSEKQSAAPTYKRGFGFHPRLAFADHGSDGTGEPVAALLRPGNAGSNTAADHIGVTRKALAQLPNAHTAWPGKRVLVRTDGAVASHNYLTWLHKRGVSHSIRFGLSIAARISTHARPIHLKLPKNGTWSSLIVTALTRLAAMPTPPDRTRLPLRPER